MLHTKWSKHCIKIIYSISQLDVINTLSLPTRTTHCKIRPNPSVTAQQSGILIPLLTSLSTVTGGFEIEAMNGPLLEENHDEKLDSGDACEFSGCLAHWSIDVRGYFDQWIDLKDLLKVTRVFDHWRMRFLLCFSIQHMARDYNIIGSSHLERGAAFPEPKKQHAKGCCLSDRVRNMCSFLYVCHIYPSIYLSVCRFIDLSNVCAYPSIHLFIYISI